MLPIAKKPHPLWGRIFSAPLFPVPYAGAPELAQAWRRPDYSLPSAAELRYSIFFNGALKAVKKPLPNVYERVPDLTLHHLKDVVLHKGAAISPRGAIFPDRGTLKPEKGLGGNLFIGALLHCVKPLNEQGRFVCLEPPPTEEQIIEDPVMLFCGSAAYGHLILEYLPMLWVAEFRPLPKLLIWSGHYPVLAELAEMFGRPAGDFVFFNSGTVFCKNLFIASRPFMNCSYYSDEARRIYRKIAEYFSGTAKAEHSKIYVSRLKFGEKSNRRRLLNEAECEEIFKEHGFTVIYPENMPFGEQVKYFSGADYVAGPLGSALHNIVFSLKPKRRLMALLPREGPNPDNYIFIENSNGAAEPLLLFGHYLDEISDRDILSAPWRLDLTDLKKALPLWLKK